VNFYQEPSSYTKTILSDLQGAWGNLREIVIKEHPFNDSEKLIFHINEAMSWESVRNLQQMKATLLIIRNIVNQTNASGEILFWVEETWDILTRAISELKATAYKD
jgi:hypothetical protein